MSKNQAKPETEVAIVHFGRMDNELISGPFGVFVVRNGRVSAQCTGCETRERAQTVAREYFSSFGATAIQEWECISIRASDGAFVGITPKRSR
jgi:hypothetical protein